MRKVFLSLCLLPVIVSAQTTLRVNQVGYRCNDFKAAVYSGNVPAEELTFELLSPEVGPAAIDSVVVTEPWAPATSSARIYFSSTVRPGEYTLSTRHKKNDAVLDVARVYIGDDAYSRFNLKELPLNYLRQQRCGYNPFHKAHCHQHDGIVVLSDSLDGEYFDLTGGWHDASDYLQYLPTTANAVYQLFFAYRANPDAWADEFDAAGDRGANGVADILDEARWGLDWLMKMNPRDSLYFNQLAYDRDHRYVGVPQCDSTDYDFGPGKGRPAYPVSGRQYGLKKYKNRSTGEASSVAKFASAFAIASEVYAPVDSAFAAELCRRAELAYQYAVAHPGASQTAPCSSPYFYEEDNWTDDTELAAAALSRLTGSMDRFAEALNYAGAERVTPWMGADTARHYQWYPFINLGHAELASKSKIAAGYMREGLEKTAARGRKNAFRYGIPFIWCSNNLAVAFVTQAMLYREITGDDSFLEDECAARDWLFGVNPWGQTMIVMPDETVASSPAEPHSALVDITVNRRPGRDGLIGAVVDGPVYDGIFNKLWGVHLRREDKFAPYQGRAVYHDDFSDYSTNEPTMDGTASLAYMLLRLSGL